MILIRVETPRPRAKTVTHDCITLTLIGGPNALLEIGGLGLLTDPTFDPPRSCEASGIVVTKQPACAGGGSNRRHRRRAAEP